MTTAQIFGFPETVNEKAARTVAAGVVTMVVLAEISHSPLFLIILLYGFLGALYFKFEEPVLDFMSWQRPTK